MDVTKLDQWKQTVQLAVDRFGTLDVLMNVAGYLSGAKSYEPNEKEVNLHVDVNTKVSFQS